MQIVLSTLCSFRMIGGMGRPIPYKVGGRWVTRDTFRLTQSAGRSACATGRLPTFRTPFPRVFLRLAKFGMKLASVSQYTALTGALSS
jgi:hypothetical protein